jgi:hypothetical protein
MTKLLLLAGLLILLGMGLIGPLIVSELSSVFLNGPSAPKPTVDSDTPPRRYRYQAYVQFQTPQGPRVGYVQGFVWSKQFQDWSYDVQSVDGVVFENVLQKDITGLQETPVP